MKITETQLRRFNGRLGKLDISRTCKSVLRMV